MTPNDQRQSNVHGSMHLLRQVFDPGADARFRSCHRGAIGVLQNNGSAMRGISISGNRVRMRKKIVADFGAFTDYEGACGPVPNVS